MSPEVSVERYTAARHTDWNELVRSARARHFMFEREYLEYHADRFDDYSWIVLLGKRVIGALPATKAGATIVSHGGLTFGGLMSTADLTVSRTETAFELLIDAWRGDGMASLEYKPMPYPYRIIPADEDLYVLFSKGARLIGRDITSAIAPGSSVAYSVERLRAVGRGRREVEVVPSDDLGEFMNLLTGMLEQRHGVRPVHEQAELELLRSRFPEQIHLFGARKHGKLVGGTLIFDTGRVAHAQYIAASEDGRRCGALDAIFDLLITDWFSDRWVDFGISNERDGSLNDGLIRNKEGYGARAVLHDRYALEL